MVQHIDIYVKRIAIANIERVNKNLKNRGVLNNSVGVAEEVSRVLNSDIALKFLRNLVSIEILLDSGRTLFDVVSLNEGNRVYYANKILERSEQVRNKKLEEFVLSKELEERLANKVLETLEQGGNKKSEESVLKPNDRDKQELLSKVKKPERGTDESLFVFMALTSYIKAGKEELFIGYDGRKRAGLLLDYCSEEKLCEVLNKGKGKKNWIIKSNSFDRDKSWRSWVSMVGRGLKKDDKLD